MLQFSIKQFADVPVLLLHPEIYGYKFFLPDLLADASRTLLYIPLEKPNTSAAQLSQAISNAVAAQARLNLPALQTKRTLSAWGRDVMIDLASVAPYCLVLDSIDLLDEVACTSLIQALIENLSEGSQIILNGRRFPAILMANQDLRSMVTLVPTDEEAMVLDYMRPRDHDLLEVHAFGPGRVLKNGARIADWDGILPLHLFLYMIDRVMVSRSDIFKAFWPELSTKEATNVFHVTKRKVNEILGFDLTDYVSGYYQVTAKLELQYDVFKFMTLVNESSILEGQAAIDCLTRALRLYRSDFLSGINSTWANERRDQLRSMAGEVLHTLSELHAQQGDDQHAQMYHSRAASMV
jgi:hypothetical protein